MRKGRLYAAGIVLAACVVCAAAWRWTLDRTSSTGCGCAGGGGGAATGGGGSSRPARAPVNTAGLIDLDVGLGPDAVTQATPGNPRGIKPPHLRATGKQRPPFRVRPGLTNLALYKPVSASEAEPVTGDVDQITDGLKKSGNFDFVEFGPALGWVQIDLERVRTVHAVVVWHYYKNATIYNDVIVRLADDAEFTRNVRTLFNNDHDNSAAMGKGADTAFYTRWWGEIVDARGPSNGGTEARYVRVYTAAGMEGEPPRFVEIAVYGT